MSQAAPAITRSPADVVRMTPVSQAGNGVCYAVAGESSMSSFDLERMIAAVPAKAATALKRKAYYFVPLTVTQGEEILIADRYDVTLSDNAVCHRNLNLGDSQCVFISTRLMDDKFSVAFEFYINVGHALVESAGVSEEFSALAWKQVQAGTRGETSLDAWEARKLALAGGPDAERFKNEYFEATFSDTISIYLLSLYLDVDYYDLRERDYPLLAPSALAERLRKVAELFSANAGFEFAVLYKRRGEECSFWFPVSGFLTKTTTTLVFTFLPAVGGQECPPHTIKQESFVSDHEIQGAGLIGAYGDRSLPGFGLGE